MTLKEKIYEALQKRRLMSKLERCDFSGDELVTDYSVAPREPTRHVETLNEFMRGLVPGIEPAHIRDFENKDGMFRLGRITFTGRLEGRELEQVITEGYIPGGLLRCGETVSVRVYPSTELLYPRYGFAPARNSILPESAVEHISLNGTALPEGAVRAIPNRKDLDVAAAVISNGEGYLITKNRNNLWRFPGGRKTPTETLEGCVVRGTREKLGIGIKPLFDSMLNHCYDEDDTHVHLRLCVYNAKITDGQPARKDCEDYAWARPDQMAGYEFTEPDRKIVNCVLKAG